MTYAMEHRFLVGMVAGVLLVAACAGTREPDAGSTLAGPSGGSAPGTTAGVSTSSVETTTGNVVWDYVALGDSYTGSATWPEMYASYLEEDLGVEVVFHNEARGRQSADRALERIRTDQRLRDLLSEAEVITVGLGFDEFRVPLFTYGRSDGECGGDDNEDCLREAMAGVRADWEALLDELVALRSPDDAIIVTLKKAAWPAERACEWGTECWQVLAGYFVDVFDFVEATALARDIWVVDALEALHAPGVYEAPINPDYLLSDRMHLSDEGSAIIADLLRDLGYR